MPDFRLQDGVGKWLTREELSKDGPLVVFFYPRDDTPGCTAQACGFQSSLGEFEELGATVVGVGKPLFFSLAVGGERGVDKLFEILAEEIRVAMALTGCASLADITGDVVCTR